MSDDARHRVVSGATWSQFCERLEAAGRLVLDEKHELSDLDRAEGLRYVSRVARGALETFVEYADPRAPKLRRIVHETVKMGADNPDNHYLNAAISGDSRYRIVGTRGSVHSIAFATQAGHYGKGAGLPPTGFLEGTDLVLGDDGSLEIDVSQTRPRDAKNWLPMTPKTGTLLVRQTFLDQGREVPATLDLERVLEPGEPQSPEPLSPEFIDAALTQSGNLTFAATSLFAGWARGFAKKKNELPPFDPALAKAFGGDPNIFYFHGYWQLQPGQALVVETTPPPCTYWNFQLNNYWMESLDYRQHRIHVNKHTAHRREDGSIKLVISETDPGLDEPHDWLQTAGHDRGTMTLRWVRAEHHPHPDVRVVEL